MKFETVLLHSLFAASLLICLSVMGAMLTTKSPAPVAANQAPTATLTNAAG